MPCFSFHSFHDNSQAEMTGEVRNTRTSPDVAQMLLRAVTCERCDRRNEWNVVCSQSDRNMPRVRGQFRMRVRVQSPDGGPAPASRKVILPLYERVPFCNSFRLFRLTGWVAALYPAFVQPIQPLRVPMKSADSLLILTTSSKLETVCRFRESQILPDWASHSITAQTSTFTLCQTLINLDRCDERSEEMAGQIIDDELWALIEPLLSPARPRRFRYPGRKPVVNRAALTGILFVLTSGIRWSDLPAEMGCGLGISCWRRLRDWQQAGVWDRLHEILLAKLRAVDRIDFSRVVIDSSSDRAVGATTTASIAGPWTLPAVLSLVEGRAGESA